jgi:hypothetical protein
MSVTPTAHGSSHGSAGNDPIVYSSIVLGATGDVTFSEKTAPAAPAANKCILYCVDNGSGKTQLMAIFSSGAAQQVAIQP